MNLIKDKSFIFIIGAPRSGTTWLQTMLGSHPLVCTTIENTLYDRYIGPWVQAWDFEVENDHRPGLPMYWSDDEFYDFLRLFLNRIYERILANKPDATHLLDKRPANSEHVDVINTLLPNPLFIHLVRDGRDAAVSMMAAARDLWFVTDTIEKAATKWKEKVLQSRQAQKFEGRYLEVRYEDLLTNGVETMKQVFEFCGLPLTDSEVAALVEEHTFAKMKASLKSPVAGIPLPEAFYRKGQVGTWQEELTSEQKERFDQIAGGLLRELGY